MTADEQAHSLRVARLIRERIEGAGGWLPFDEFMQLALYAPGLGYYTAGTAKIGSGGDFTTAPELSDLFSLCVARQSAEVLEQTGGSILEIGAGTGRMAAVILQSLADRGGLPRSYAILEVSADLRERQRRRLEALPPAALARVEWLDRPPQEGWRGVILANEVLDALPCERFVVRGGIAHPLGVALDAEDRFAEVEAPASSGAARRAHPSADALARGLPDGYRSETCARLSPWLAGVSATLERGAILLFDYGLPRSHYYHPQRAAGTLRCHFKQRAHDDPFMNVGVQDITAWVDFTAVAEAATDAGLTVAGFATQAAFLLALGIEAQVAQAAGAVELARLAGEARRLMMPGEMGEAFKAMALQRGPHSPLAGFRLQDLRHSL
jgi:SAM-dependent MidA family methyltransferase